MDEFNQLLLQGQITEAIELRMESLEDTAHEYRIDIDVAKGTSLAVSLIAIPLSLSPIGLMGAAIGLCSYGYSVWTDTAKTKKFYPVPGIRQTLGELLGGIQSDRPDEDDEDLIESVCAYLDTKQAREYRTLVKHNEVVVPLLASVPDESRPMAYRYLQRMITSRGLLPTNPTNFREQVSKLASPTATPAIAPAVTPPAPLPSPAIGNNTRLGAVDVEHQQVDESNPFGELPTVAPVAVQPQWTAPAPAPPQSDRPVVEDVAGLIANAPYLLSRIFIGASRTGKSLLVANVLRQLRVRYGDRLTIWLISGANRANEAWYWEPCDRVSKYEFASAGAAEIVKAYREWGQLLQEFNQIPADANNPKLLIVDEASMIALTADRMGDKNAQNFWRDMSLKAAHLSSAGAASGAAVYLISPNGQADGLKMKRHELGAFNPVFVANMAYWNETVYLAARNNGLAPSNPPSQLEVNAARSVNCDRLVGMNGQWLPYGEVAIAPTQQPTAPDATTVEQAIAAPKPSNNPLLQNLPDELMNVARYCADKDWVTPSEVQASCRQLRDKNSAEIGSYFNTLKVLNLGSIRETQRSVQFRLSDGVRDAVMSE